MSSDDDFACSSSRVVSLSKSQRSVQSFIPANYDLDLARTLSASNASLISDSKRRTRSGLIRHGISTVLIGKELDEYLMARICDMFTCWTSSIDVKRETCKNAPVWWKACSDPSLLESHFPLDPSDDWS